MEPRIDRCLLLFSGGRDSTLAALRLAKRVSSLTLLTVTSDHLIGIHAVKARLEELASHLPNDTEWLNVARNPIVGIGPADVTCLPCHHLYVSIGVKYAHAQGIGTMAMGYAGYQSHWPEQTPAATAILGSVLGEQGIQLLLPVYDVMSKEAAEAELAAHGLTVTAQEQKCLRQLKSSALDERALSAELDGWEKSLRRTLAGPEAIAATLVSQVAIGRERPS